MSTLRLQICTLAGNLCTIIAEPSWTVLDLKRSVRVATGVPIQEQRLCLGTVGLEDLEPLGTYLEDGEADVLFVRVQKPVDRDHWIRRVSRDGCGLRWAPECLRNDYEVVHQAVSTNPNALRYASEELRSDPHLASVALEGRWEALRYASRELQEDRNFVSRALQREGRSLQFVAPALQADRGLVSMAIMQTWVALRFASEELRQNPEVVALAVQSGMPLQRAPPALRLHRAVLAASFLRDGQGLRFAEDELRDDWDFVAAAVMQSGDALRYASTALRADRGLVRLALQQDGRALQHAAVELRNDPDLVSLAVEHPAQALRDWVDGPTLQDGIIAIATQSCSALQFASDALRSERDLVLHAVERNGRALQYASKELRDDKGLVQVAVRQNWAALRSASSDLRADRDIVFEALRQDQRALRFAAESLQKELGGPVVAPTENKQRLSHGGGNGSETELKQTADAIVGSLNENTLAIRLTDLSQYIDKFKEQRRTVLVLANKCADVEDFFRYQIDAVVDCKQLITEVLIRKTKTKGNAQHEMRTALADAMNTRNFCKTLHIRMANTVFDWDSFCFDGFPRELFNGSLWTLDEAFSRNIIDEAQKFNCELDPAIFKEFHVVITSSFCVEDAQSGGLLDAIPYSSELAILIIKDASLTQS